MILNLRLGRQEAALGAAPTQLEATSNCERWPWLYLYVIGRCGSTDFEETHGRNASSSMHAVWRVPFSTGACFLAHS